MIPINNLPLKRLGDNNLITKVDYRSATDDVSFIVIVGLFDSLKANVCLLMAADHCEVQRKGTVIIDRKDFINAVNLIDRVSRDWMKEIGNNVVHSGKVDNFWSIFLNNQSPVADTISIEVCEGKVLVIHIDLDNVTKKDIAILLESFNNCKEFQLDNFVASLSIGKFATVECQGLSVLLNY
jgi:hypothetical protein